MHCNRQILLSLPDSVPWYGRVASRIAAYWWLKAIGTSLFMTGFFFGYMYLLKNPLFPVTVMPMTFVDALVGFRPEALSVYLSLWFYVSLPPALLDSKPELYSFLRHVSALCLAGMACFLLWPTAVPAADLAWQGYSGFAMLKGIDDAGNACPSLHAATAVFSGIWLGRLLTETGCPSLLRVFNWAWCLGILYSTLAVKQHVALDVLAGASLGWAAALLALKRRPAAVPA